MNRKRTLDRVSQLLTAIGSINWGLIGVAGFNLVAAIFGAESFLTRLIYSLVGLAGGWSLFRFVTRMFRPRMRMAERPAAAAA